MKTENDCSPSFLNTSKFKKEKKSHGRTQDGEAFLGLGFSHVRRISTT